MKILFIGLGSIGQRHLQNVIGLFGDSVELLAFRQTKHNNVIQKGTCEQEELTVRYPIKEFDDYELALSENPDVVFITNPTSMHVSTAIKAAEKGCHLFIEKPLGNDLVDIPRLNQIVKDKNLIAMVGYQFRYHPLYEFSKNVLRNKEYGRVVSGAFEWGTYLPTHHPYEDYREGYAARNDLGGGVVLGLIHEIDMIKGLFGMPSEINAIGGKLSSLEMDAEDTVSVLFRFDDSDKSVPVSIFLSYAQTKEIHRFKIQLEKATLFVDFDNNSGQLFGQDSQLIDSVDTSLMDRNELFISEIKDFFNAMENHEITENNLENGLSDLELALKIKAQIG